tara:strand:- start:3532 stop:4479 length:948 start_codon:yes stop_codon:yes gene_type:complete
MSFFNKKEEVLEIQLTQYGKYLLSKGKFKPVFYSFSDDEILYDTAYAENKNEVKQESFERIQEDTVRLRPIYDHESAEERVKRRNEQIATNLIDNPRTGLLERIQADGLYGSDNVDDNFMVPDNRRLVRNLLGTSELGNQNAPSWVVQSLNEERFESPILVSSSFPNIGHRRPQINIIVDHNVNSEDLRADDFVGLEQFFSQDGTENQIDFIDGVRLKIKDSRIVLEFEEKNVSYDKENFEIEFFSVDQEKEMENGQVVQEEQLSKLFIDAPGIENPLNVSTFLEILYDDQIVIDEDFDFETYTIEVMEDEDFCD